MVMPVLRRFDDPEFVAPCEVVDFISQALEVRFRVLSGGALHSLRRTERPNDFYAFFGDRDWRICTRIL